MLHSKQAARCARGGTCSSGRTQHERLRHRRPVSPHCILAPHAVSPHRPPARHPRQRTSRGTLPRQRQGEGEGEGEAGGKGRCGEAARQAGPRPRSRRRARRRGGQEPGRLAPSRIKRARRKDRKARQGAGGRRGAHACCRCARGSCPASCARSPLLCRRASALAVRRQVTHKRARREARSARWEAGGAYTPDAGVVSSWGRLRASRHHGISSHLLRRTGTPPPAPHLPPPHRMHDKTKGAQAASGWGSRQAGC